MAMRREQETAWTPQGQEMRLSKLPAVMLAAALILSGFQVYSVPVVSAAEGTLGSSEKPLKFHYVCPMHQDITSHKRGTCPKCKMKLVKKPVPQEPAQ